MTNNNLKEFESKMEKTVQVLKEELAGIRAGRANPHLLDRITVDYYGTPTPINQLANIAVPEARQITIQPWDAKTLNDIVKAIQTSDLNLNPNNDGKIIRLIFPPLTEERRHELTKEVRKLGERDKVAIRQIRRDAIEHFKKLEKSKELTEDDLKDMEKDTQKLTDDFIEKVDRVVEGKIAEIMEV